MFDRFTSSAKQTMVSARREADRLDHDRIGSEHVLLGLPGLSNEVAHTLERDRVTLDRGREVVERIMVRGQGMQVSSQLPFSPNAKFVLQS